MSEEGWVTSKIARDALRISRMELHRRTKPGHPRFIVSKPCEDGKQGRLYQVPSIDHDAQTRWKQQASGHNLPEESPSDPASTPAPQMELPIPHTETEKVFAAVLAELVKTDPFQAPCIRERFHAIQPLLNHDWRAAGYKTLSDYERHVAAQLDRSVKTLRRLRRTYLDTEAQAGTKAAILSLGIDKPGPDAGYGSLLTPDIRARIAELWCGSGPECKRLTRRQIYRDIMNYVQEKAQALGGEHLYSYVIRSQEGAGPKNPLFYSIIRFINAPPPRGLGGDLNPQRNGPEAAKAAAGYIDRKYDEYAGDAWCMDEWEIDGAFYDDENRSQLINYGRGNPIAHVLTVLDERTTYIIDYLVTWAISLEEGVFILAERVIRNHFLPLRVVADRAGRFRALVRGHIVVGRDGGLVEKLAGPLGDLGVKPRGSEKHNPRANRLERMQGLYAARARDFGVSWKPPMKGHEPRELDDRVKRHLREHCKYGIVGPQLMSIQEAEGKIAQWVEEINLAETRARGCQGLTRLAAWRQFQPPIEEIARRKPTQAEIDLAFAERAERTVLPGGIIQLADGARYSAELLAGYVGEILPVLRYRRDPLTLIVSPPGEPSFQAERRAVVGTQDEELLAREIAKQERIRKALGGEPAVSDREMARIMEKLPRHFAERRPSVERTATSSELARQILKMGKT